jgi:hypothetical protein
MSWSLTLPATPKADARHQIEKVFRAQGAYGYDGAHKLVMDEATEFAAKIAELSPDGLEVGVNSYGHFNSPSGTGSVTITVNVGKPVPIT